jgi:hypothetical protein
MKKLLFLGVLGVLLSCSKDDKNDCPNGEIVGISNVQDQGYLTLDNGKKIPVAVSKLSLYNTGDCYEGTK